LDKTLDEMKPRIVGVTGTTPLYYETAQISRLAKEKLGKEVTTVLGGPHASALPEECLETSDFDIVAVGEGDNTIVEIAGTKKLFEINGIYYKDDGKI
jgi:anaerobic magnesium-protoporphyrin IX monomethyl ester cyclase